MIWLTLSIDFLNMIMKVWNKMSDSKKLSISKIKRLLSLSKFIASKKSKDKATALSFLDQSSINDISESIYNLLYN